MDTNAIFLQTTINNVLLLIQQLLPISYPFNVILQQQTSLMLSENIIQWLGSRHALLNNAK